MGIFSTIGKPGRHKSCFPSAGKPSSHFQKPKGQLSHGCHAAATAAGTSPWPGKGRGLCRDEEPRGNAAKAKKPLMELESWGCNCFPIVVSLFSSIPFKHLSGHCVKVSMENPPGCPEEGDVEICL